MKGLHSGSAIWDETTVKVNQPKELTELTLGGRLLEVPNDFYLSFQWADAIAVHAVPEKI